MMEKVRSNKGGIKILVAILIVLIIIAGILLVEKINRDKKQIEVGTAKGENIENTNIENINTENDTIQQIAKPKTFEGDERPIAFMIDNNIKAMPQAGLLEADLIYEIIVEGGETRLMAVMKNKELEKIGPLRSARHYFLDYALENDAIYVHYGQSPQAESDIKSLGVNNINGMYESSKNFWRVKDRYAPHNAVTSTEKLKEVIKAKGYRTTTNKSNVLNYVAEDFDLEDIKEKVKSGKNTNSTKNNQTSSNEQSENQENEKVTNIANTVTIPYSTVNTVKYTYDKKTKTYIRYSRKKKQVDWDTQKDVTTKNIIITKCKNTTLNDGTTKGRQTISNIKKLDGYYITNGKYIPITCEKTSRSGKTVYKDLEGNEIKVNDGKTFIQICPIDSKITFE